MSSETHKRLADALCATIAKRQFGLISRRQAIDVGMTPDMISRRIAARRWEELHPGAYRIAGAPPSQQQEAMAACLRAGPGTFVCGRTAAAAWGLEGGRWAPPEVVSSRQLSAAKAPVIVRRSRTHTRDDVTFLGPLPLTTPTRTLIDLAGRVNATTLELALDQCLRAGRLSLPALDRRVGALAKARLPGIRLLRTLISERDPNCAFTPTELETLVRHWLRRYTFPEPIFQFWVQLPDYGPSRLDFAYPELQVGVEADSYAWHSGREAFERDRARNSEYASLGWIIIQTTHREIERFPDRPARRLRAAFDQRM
jgi:very-short-patch-repair endonuclease